MQTSLNRKDLQRLAKGLTALTNTEKAVIVSMFWKDTGIPFGLEEEYKSALKKLEPYL